MGNDGNVLSTAAISTGVAGYLLASPVIHWRHGSLERAGASLGLRLILPIAAVGVGSMARPRSEHCPAQSEAEYEQYCEPQNKRVTTIAVVSGLLAASLIDALALSWEPPPKRTAGLTLAPVLGWDGARGGRLGLAGVF